MRGRPFTKGQSGNPGGRPKEEAHVRDLARAQTVRAVETLVAIMENKRSPAAARVSAAIALLDRGYGRPAQQVNVDATLRPSDVSAEPLTAEEWVAKYSAIGAPRGGADGSDDGSVQ